MSFKSKKKQIVLPIQMKLIIDVLEMSFHTCILFNNFGLLIANNLAEPKLRLVKKGFSVFLPLGSKK